MFILLTTKQASRKSLTILLYSILLISCNNNQDTITAQNPNETLFQIDTLIIVDTLFQMDTIIHLDTVIIIDTIIYIDTIFTHYGDIDSSILETFFTTQKLADNLLIDISPNSQFITFQFENGLIVSIDSIYIHNFDIDRELWIAEIFFYNSESIIIPFLGNNFEIKEENIVLNPFNSTPLSALINIETPVEGKFALKVKGQDGQLSDVLHNFNIYSSQHTLEVHGLYIDYENEVEIYFLSKNNTLRTTNTIVIKTLNVEYLLPEFEIIESYSNLNENVFFYLNYRPLNMPIIIDVFGKIRYLTLGGIFHNTGIYGFFRANNSNFIYGDAFNHQVVEYNMISSQIITYPIGPEYQLLHHDVYEMENGNLLVTADKINSDTIHDVIIEIDRDTRSIIKEWDFSMILDKRYTLVDDIVDWLHINAIVFDNRDNSIIVSGQRQGLIKINYTTGELIWILSEPTGWNNHMASYLLNNNGSEDDYPYGQHSPEILPNGNLLFFDNGFGRKYSNEEKYSRAVEYEINELDKSFELIWEYGKERGEEVFSPIISDVDYLHDTNTRLITFGSFALEFNYIDSTNISAEYSLAEEIKAKIIEINEQGTILFEINVISYHQLIGSVYRAEKISLYPND